MKVGRFLVLKLSRAKRWPDSGPVQAGGALQIVVVDHGAMFELRQPDQKYCVEIYNEMRR